MSTILKTLKKLEEDKRLLEKELDFKELVLQEDQFPTVRKTLQLNQKKIMATGLVLAGFIITLLLAWGFKSSPNEVATPYVKQVPTQKNVLANNKGSRTTVGIPLSNIAEQESYYAEEITANNQPEKYSIPLTEEIFESAIQPKVQTLPIPSEINEIRDLIKNAKMGAEKRPELMTHTPESPTPGLSIPGLRIKGIIFFSSGNPSNHIFVSTAGSSNQKLRMGDAVQSAILQHIESNRVIFSYQGGTVHLRIGE